MTRRTPPCITALVDAEGEVRVKAGRRTLATLTRGEVQTLGLAAGSVWTDELHLRAKGFANARAALAQCLRWLRVADRSAHELRERLLAKGFAPADTEAALKLLAGTRLQSDEALQARTESKLKQAGASDAKISRTLQAKGLKPLPVKPDASGSDEASRALALARAAIAKPGSAETRVRRALGALARSEYDEETAREAVMQASREAGVATPDEGQ
jgi:SOS response regulatory protein OraA/RecX